MINKKELLTNNNITITIIITPTTITIMAVK